MSVTVVKEYLRQFRKSDRIQKVNVPITSIEEASDALGIMPSKLVTCAVFMNKTNDGCIMIITSGDAIVDKSRYKAKFRYIPEELDESQTVEYTGYNFDDLCPFAVKEETTKIYLDKTLKRYDYIYPSGGDLYSVVKLSPDELFRCSKAVDWVEMAKAW